LRVGWCRERVAVFAAEAGDEVGENEEVDEEDEESEGVKRWKSS